MSFNSQSNILSSQIQFQNNNDNLFKQVYQYKIFETNLKKAILLKDKNIIKRIRLINSDWFDKWKKISCYEAIKDLLNIYATVEVNYKFLKDNYSLIRKNLIDSEQLDININNNLIVSGFDDSSGRYIINPHSNFELISEELWDCFVPPNTNNVNNGTMVELNIEYLTNMTFMINLGKDFYYIIFWNINEQQLGKIIVTFSDESEKYSVLNNLKQLGINNFYASYLEDLIDEKYVSCGNICFSCINKTKNKSINTTTQNNNNNTINNFTNNNMNNNNYTYNSMINNYNIELLPVGLDNIGLICYMNSALQCLVNIPNLSNYFLEKKYEINEDNQILSHAYLQIVENVLRKTFESQVITSYCPIEFRDIAEINPLFRSAADSIDLINYFLATVHKELNHMTDEVILLKYYINNPNNEKQQKLNKLLTDFTYQNNSIITNIFYFIEKSKISCTKCNAIFYNFQVMNYLIFPLEEIRRYNFQKFGVNRNCVSLLEGFNYYKRISPMLGQFYCNNCHLQSTAFQCNTLYSLPEILIINLNRGRGNIFKVGISFPEILNLTSEVESNIYNCSNYKLIGVITHFGESGTSGHFIAFCFVHEKNKWYKFNDSLVSESSFQEASTNGDTYILYYQR